MGVTVLAILNLVGLVQAVLQQNLMFVQNNVEMGGTIKDFSVMMETL